MRKDYLKTIELCKKAISIQPGIVDMYTNVAAAYLSTGSLYSGIAYLYKAIAVDPEFVKSYEFLATAYSGMGKTDSAKKYQGLAQKNKMGL